VITRVPEALSAKIGKGTPATIQIDALPGQKLLGKVARLFPAIDQSTRTQQIDIDIPNEGRLLPGMTCTVTITPDQKRIGVEF
jgi:multidrug efflux pump subunit AcrA (membrane-fusion protein)